MKRRELLLGAGAVRERIIAVDDHQDWSDLVTLDLNPDHRPDVVWDIANLPLPFDDESFDEVHMYEVLEHVGTQGDFRFFFDQFSDFWRILRPNGAVCGSCPTVRSAWAWGDPGHTRVITKETLTFLDQEAYAKQVGITPMTDYRHWFKADFQPLFGEVANGRFFFALRTMKPVRSFMGKC